MQEVNTKESLKGRSDYQHDYYESVVKPKRKESYVPQTQYIRLVEVKKVLNRLKKEIGTNSYNLILADLSEIEIKKM